MYITTVSLNYDSLEDSIAVLNKEVVELSLIAKKLSNPKRIENIVKKSLELDYPSSNEIVIVRPEKKKLTNLFWDSHFWLIIKKSLTSRSG